VGALIIAAAQSDRHDDGGLGHGERRMDAVDLRDRIRGDRGACGGGSSSTTTATRTTFAVLTVPLQTASANLVNDGFNASVSVSGWYGNTTTAATGNATVSLQKAVGAALGSTSVLSNVQGILGTLDLPGGSTDRLRDHARVALRRGQTPALRIAGV
jgi:hypothetical protein